LTLVVVTRLRRPIGDGNALAVAGGYSATPLTHRLAQRTIRCRTLP